MTANVLGIDSVVLDRIVEDMMKLTEFFLEQLEREAASTRLALQRVPEGHNDWKPHEKSMPLGYLASRWRRCWGGSRAWSTWTNST